MKLPFEVDVGRLRTILGQMAVVIFAGAATELLFVREAGPYQLMAASFVAAALLAGAIIKKPQFQTGN